MIDEILSYNKEFVARHDYEQYITDKYPSKKLAVLTCMDTRLTELLPAALGLKNGDAKIIKNAGGLVISPFDSAIRSLVVAIYELGVEEIMVVAHTTCGACHMSFSHFRHEMNARGITDETLDTVSRCGVNLEQWLEGFHDTHASVRSTMESIRNHPLVPAGIVVRGFIIDSVTGALEEVMPEEEVAMTTPENITTLKPDEVFVFGSNLHGAHGGGAARQAYDCFGAEWGVGVGRTGQCYAIPTMQGGVETIRPYVDEFIHYAEQHPELTFFVTRIGCGIAGFTDEEIAPLFAAARRLRNVALPAGWR